MNSPPKRADKHVLFRLECPGLLFGIKGVPLGAQRCGLGAQQHAIDRGCCKLTLEVLTGNARALTSYLGFGFEPYALDPAAGQASFMQKWL